MNEDTSLTAAGSSPANPACSTTVDAFVGREREMEALRAGLNDAIAGRGRLYLLSGEPGIGKSRLGVDTPNPRAARRTNWLLAVLIAVGTALAVPLPRFWRPAEACAIASLSESDCETEAPTERTNLTPEFDPPTDYLRHEPRTTSRRFWFANYRRPPPFLSLA